MTDITTYPMIDDFDTTLAQAWDGAVGTVYLNDAVGITIPASTTTYLVVNPGKSTMQVAEINAVNNTLKTATVSSITVDKGAGVAYTQQSHPVGSVVRISTNYAFWKDIVDAVNTKVNTNDDDIAQGKFADATARDAYFTAPVNGNSAYLTAEGKRTDYIAGAWADRDVGTVTANASTTVAGKVELATEAEGIAGTATGATGASLDLTPDLIAKITQSGSWVYCASATGSDTYTANLTPSLTAYTTGMLLPCKFTTTNTGACSININSLGAKNIKTLDGNDPQTGVIRANGTALLMYDGTNFVIQSEDFATATVKGINNIYNIGGLGGDGNLTISSGTTTITGAGGIAYKEYDNVTISGTATLTSNQRLTHIKVKGNFTMSAGTIQVNGLGSSGGSGTSDNGDNIYNQYALTTIGGGTSGESTGAGGGATQSTVGKDFMIVHSGGGGGTSQDFNGGAIAGGAGGGILIIEVGGAINFTGGTISANGSVGGSTGGYASASGGGGGGGSIVILYRTLTAISGTIQATGGAGGVSGGSSTAYNFGGGGGGGYGAGGNYNSAGSAGLALGATATVTGGNAGSGGTQADSRGGGGGGGFVYVTQY